MIWLTYCGHILVQLRNIKFPLRQYELAPEGFGPNVAKLVVYGQTIITQMGFVSEIPGTAARGSQIWDVFLVHLQRLCRHDKKQIEMPCFPKAHVRNVVIIFYL